MAPTQDDLGQAWAAAMRRGDDAAAWAVNDAVLAARDPASADDPAVPQIRPDRLPEIDPGRH